MLGVQRGDRITLSTDQEIIIKNIMTIEIIIRNKKIIRNIQIEAIEKEIGEEEFNHLGDKEHLLLTRVHKYSLALGG